MFKAHLREVARLAWPAVLQGLAMTAVFFTDRLLLGWYGPETLGAMQIAGPVLWSTFSICGAFAVGVMAVIGRSVGAGDTQRARQTLISSLTFAVGAGLLVTALGFAVAEPLTQMLAGGPDTSEEIRLLGRSYMDIVFLGATFNFITWVGMVALQADGDTRTPMWLSVFQGAINLSLSWVLIFGHFGAPELGIEGAAIGSLVSLVVEALAVLMVLYRRTGHVSLRPLIRPKMSAFIPVLRVSLPTLGERAIFHTAFLVFAAYVGQLGDLAMTANQALIAVESVGFMVTHGIGMAASAIVAQKLGAAEPQNAQSVGWISAGLGVSVMTAVSIIFLTIPETLVGLFSPQASVIQLAAPCLQVAAIALPLMAISDAMAGSLRGAGDTRTPMLVAIVGPTVVRLFFCWYLALDQGWGLLGIWVGTTLDWAARATLLTLVFHRGKWKTIVV